MPRPQPLELELGCGKGNFVGALALRHPERNFLAIDRKDEVLGTARRIISAGFAAKGREMDNLILTAYDIERILEILGPEDRVERIYINFCNPWLWAGITSTGSPIPGSSPATRNFFRRRGDPFQDG